MCGATLVHGAESKSFAQCGTSVLPWRRCMLLSGPVQNSIAFGVGQQLSASNSVAEICIIGDGAEGLALANIAAAHGVLIYADGNVCAYPSLEELQVRDYEVRERGAQVGSARGKTRIDLRNVDRIDDLQNADGFVIAASSTKYGALIEKIAPALRDGQTICLTNAPLGAALEFKHLLRKNNIKRQLNLIEVGRIFDNARVESGVLLISGLRSRVSLCGLERNETRRGLPVATAVAGTIVPFSNVIERGLADAERILRPAILLSALLTGEAQLSLSPATIRILKAIDKEIQGLSKAFKCVVPSFTRSLADFSLSEGSALRHKPVSLEAAVKALGRGLLGLGGKTIGNPSEDKNAAYLNHYRTLLSQDICES